MLYSFWYSCDVASFYLKLEMIANKVSEFEFYLVDMCLNAQPYLKQP
jgi:hypothetical protein